MNTIIKNCIWDSVSQKTYERIEYQISIDIQNKIDIDILEKLKEQIFTSSENSVLLWSEIDSCVRILAFKL